MRAVSLISTAPSKRFCSKDMSDMSRSRETSLLTREKRDMTLSRPCCHLEYEGLDGGVADKVASRVRTYVSKRVEGSFRHFSRDMPDLRARVRDGMRWEEMNVRLKLDFNELGKF